MLEQGERKKLTQFTIADLYTLTVSLIGVILPIVTCKFSENWDVINFIQFHHFHTIRTITLQHNCVMTLYYHPPILSGKVSRGVYSQINDILRFYSFNLQHLKCIFTPLSELVINSWTWFTTATSWPRWHLWTDIDNRNGVHQTRLGFGQPPTPQ